MLVSDIEVGRLSLIELREDKVSFHGVTPFYLIARAKESLQRFRSYVRSNMRRRGPTHWQ